MADDTVIKVDNLSKSFRLPHEKNSTIKSAVINLYRRKRTYEKLEALKDISFEVKKGEFFGIVGRNGSGKSTLLKLLAGIYSPSAGNIAVNGKLTPFIELGVGFNPELTGRENVFLNGALLGFGRKEMATMYDDIVTFAELERFMDQKLKNYSSGMQVRLAFSIAIRVKSDILILDEVLAVGDEAFQQKCIDVFEKYKAQKQTIVLVTHDMEIVRRFCSSAMLIHNGKIVSEGDPREVAQKYSKYNEEKIDKDMEKENAQNKRKENEQEEDQEESNIDLKILPKGDKQKTSYVTDEALTVGVSWPKNTPKVSNVGVGIVKQSGEFIFGANTFNEDVKLNGECKIVYSVKLSLGPGKYYLMAGLFGDKQSQTIDFLSKGPQFIIRPKEGDVNQGLGRLEYKWGA
jgi:ABC-2 type transport system ATP-binding protein